MWAFLWMLCGFLLSLCSPELSLGERFEQPDFSMVKNTLFQAIITDITYSL